MAIAPSSKDATEKEESEGILSEKQTILELRITIKEQVLSIANPKNASNEEYLLIKGLPVDDGWRYWVREVTIVRNLDKPLEESAINWLNSLKKKGTIQDWQIKERKS